ncbi:MAG: hypothetical protein M1820_004656 [Bogoriella megaspora]|nr:MAG: hypothetical protein M1820_004656 [Bogoriella megaspora]
MPIPIYTGTPTIETTYLQWSAEAAECFITQGHIEGDTNILERCCRACAAHMNVEPPSIEDDEDLVEQRRVLREKWAKVPGIDQVPAHLKDELVTAAREAQIRSYFDDPREDEEYIRIIEAYERDIARQAGSADQVVEKEAEPANQAAQKEAEPANQGAQKEAEPAVEVSEQRDEAAATTPEVQTNKVKSRFGHDLGYYLPEHPTIVVIPGENGEEPCYAALQCPICLGNSCYRYQRYLRGPEGMIGHAEETHNAKIALEDFREKGYIFKIIPFDLVKMVIDGDDPDLNISQVQCLEPIKTINDAKHGAGESMEPWKWSLWKAHLPHCPVVILHPDRKRYILVSCPRCGENVSNEGSFFRGMSGIDKHLEIEHGTNLRTMLVNASWGIPEAPKSQWSDILPQFVVREVSFQEARVLKTKFDEGKLLKLFNVRGGLATRRSSLKREHDQQLQKEKFASGQGES